jgi:AraC-like DNA-binding protein
MPKESQSQRIARSFGLNDVPITIVYTSPGLAITLVELDLSRSGGGESLPMRADDAFLLMRFMGQNECFLLDLRMPSSFSWSYPLRGLAIYVPRQVFFNGSDQCIERHTLRCDKRMDDTILASIMDCLGDSLIGRRSQGRNLFVRHMLLAACARLVQLRAVEPNQLRIAPRALTMEQRRNATSIMRDRMEGGVSIRELADACGIVHAEFVRAFKRSFGVSPRDWLTARRFERAVELMSDRSLPLTEIACKAGFSDSSQFSRLFMRFMGHPPGLWRRESLGI